MIDASVLTQKRREYAILLKSSVNVIVNKLSGMEQVERISLFGSYARGKEDLFTDLDVLVIMRTDLDFVERLRFLYSKMAVPVDLDLLCYTPEEWENLKTRPFFRGALQAEKVVYEKKRS
jgi:predicted nucleotidyltransferase